MKMTIGFGQFLDNWPESIKEQFSYEALRAIFDWYEGYEADTGEEVEYDPVAICCEWTEHESATEAAREYGHEAEGETEDEKEEDAQEWLQDRTTVLPIGKGVVLMQF